MRLKVLLLTVILIVVAVAGCSKLSGKDEPDQKLIESWLKDKALKEWMAGDRSAGSLISFKQVGWVQRPRPQGEIWFDLNIDMKCYLYRDSGFFDGSGFKEDTPVNRATLPFIYMFKAGENDIPIRIIAVKEKGKWLYNGVYLR